MVPFRFGTEKEKEKEEARVNLNTRKRLVVCLFPFFKHVLTSIATPSHNKLYLETIISNSIRSIRQLEIQSSCNLFTSISVTLSNCSHNMGALLGVSNQETLRRIEAAVGSDGYHEWEKMHLPEKYQTPDLPELDYHTKRRLAQEVLDGAVAQILSIFEDDGAKPFENERINKTLDRMLISQSEELMNSFDFTPDGQYSFPTVKSLVEEVAQETLKNDILATTLAIARREGVDIFIRQNPEIEREWIEEAVYWTFILHVMTNTCFHNRKLVKTLRGHFQELREGPLKAWKDIATEFEFMKTISVDPGIALFEKERSKPIKENELRGLTLMGLSMNILEAMWEDYRSGNKINAQAGYELAVIDGLFDFTRQANRARKVSKYSTMYKYSPIPRNWADLFQSWDLNVV